MGAVLDVVAGGIRPTSPQVLGEDNRGLLYFSGTEEFGQVYSAILASDRKRIAYLELFSGTSKAVAHPRLQLKTASPCFQKTTARCSFQGRKCR